MKRSAFAALPLLICLFAALVLAGEPTENFGQSVDYKPSKDELDVTLTIQRMCKKEGLEPPIWDSVLSLAAKDVAIIGSSNDSNDKRVLNNDQISAAIQKYGGVDSAITTQAVQIMFISDAGELFKQEKVIKNIRDLELTHMGVGIKSKLFPPSKLIIVIFSRRPLQIEKFPKKIIPQQNVSLTGRIFPGIESPRLLLRKPSGKIAKIPIPTIADGSFSLPVPFDEGGGAYTLQVQVEASRGPEIVAQFDVAHLGDLQKATMSAPHIVIPDVEPAKTEAEAEAAVYSMINTARLSAGKTFLSRHSTLDQMARAYAKQMMEQNFFGHVDPQGLSVKDRAKEWKIKYLYVGENIAINENEVKAHRGLMDSPSHSSLVLDDRFTQCGVGIVFRGAGQSKLVYLVEIFVKPR